jgi:hypothetical protein
MYNDKIHIECRYESIRHYEIYLEINDDVVSFTYVWDAHFTQDANIQSIRAEIDRQIIKLYRKEN